MFVENALPELNYVEHDNLWKTYAELMRVDECREYTAFLWIGDMPVERTGYFTAKTLAAAREIATKHFASIGYKSVKQGHWQNINERGCDFSIKHVRQYRSVQIKLYYTK